MNHKLLNLTKSKIYINLFLLLFSSFFILFFSHEAEYNMIKNVMHASYLHTENYILMIISIVILLYFLITQIYTYLKEKNKFYLSIFIINVLLLLGLTPYVLEHSMYNDFIGLHIDKYIGLLFLLFSIINLIIFSLIFFISYFLKNIKNFKIK